MAKGGKLREWVRKRKWRVKIKSWMLLLILVPLLFADATLLRYDHIKMTELRDAVLAADAAIGSEDAGEAEDAALTEALTELKEFVFSHIVVNVVEENGEQRISFGTGPFYLEQAYLRDATRALAEAEKQMASDNNPYGNIYGEAGTKCRAEAIRNGWAWNSSGFINCMMTEIQKYPAADELQDTIVAQLPSTELYRRNYASPVWAPTVAGCLILVTAAIILVLIFRLILWIVVRIAVFFV